MNLPSFIWRGMHNNKPYILEDDVVDYLADLPLEEIKAVVKKALKIQFNPYQAVLGTTLTVSGFRLSAPKVVQALNLRERLGPQEALDRVKNLPWVFTSLSDEDLEEMKISLDKAHAIYKTEPTYGEWALEPPDPFLYNAAPQGQYLLGAYPVLTVSELLAGLT